MIRQRDQHLRTWWTLSDSTAWSRQEEMFYLSSSDEPVTESLTLRRCRKQPSTAFSTCPCPKLQPPKPSIWWQSTPRGYRHWLPLRIGPGRTLGQCSAPASPSPVQSHRHFPPSHRLHSKKPEKQKHADRHPPLHPSAKHDCEQPPSACSSSWRSGMSNPAISTCHLALSSLTPCSGGPRSTRSP